MEDITIKLRDYILSRGINIHKLAYSLGIPYNKLRASFSLTGRGRELRASEFIPICIFLQLDPFQFVDQEEIDRLRNYRLYDDC